MGFTFNEIHSSEMGVGVRSKNRPVAPEVKRVTENIFGVDGVYDFSSVNPLGRPVYEEREITVECSIVGKDAEDLRQASRKIALWLSGKEARLRFDDEPFVYYLARVVNRIDLEQVAYRVGRFNLIFTCRPFAYSYRMTGVLPGYGKGLCYGDGTVYGGEHMYIINGDSITPKLEIDRWPMDQPIIGLPILVKNSGMPASPVFRFTGAVNNVKFVCGDKILTYSGDSIGTLTIDFERKKAILDDNNVTNYLIGDFFELENGDNFIQIVADSIVGYLEVIFNFRYL